MTCRSSACDGSHIYSATHTVLHPSVRLTTTGNVHASVHGSINGAVAFSVRWSREHTLFPALRRPLPSWVFSSAWTSFSRSSPCQPPPLPAFCLFRKQITHLVLPPTRSQFVPTQSSSPALLRLFSQSITSSPAHLVSLRLPSTNRPIPLLIH